MTTSGRPTVDPSNSDQLVAWDGDEGSYWAEHPDHFERALDRYDEPFFEAASIEAADRVLDIGCGTGKTTRDAARAATAGSVLGVDLSSAMLSVARQRAADERLDNVVFEQVDAQIHPFEHQSFDVAIGRTSAMFFGDRVAALTNIGHALRPAGRLTLLTWQPLEGNEWIQEFTTALAAGRELPSPPPDAPGPFTLADPKVIETVLASAGYDDISIDGVRAPMWFGHDTEDAYDVVHGLLAWMLLGLDDQGRVRAQEALHDTIASHESPDGVLYESAAWVIHATHP
jgi:SAM-dependent methyltransferase